MAVVNSRSPVGIIWVCTALAAVATACGSNTATRRTGSSTQPMVTTIPNRDGPFAVGKRVVTFVDATRGTPANGSSPAQHTRSLETLIEYPTQGTPDGAQERTDAPPRSGMYPMLVYLHGFGAHADNPYLHPWAAAGFVAVSPKEPLTNTDAPGGPDRVDVANIPRDIQFVISRVLADPTLQAIIDRNEIGVMGASLGAAMAYEVGYGSRTRDARIKAVIEQSCGCPPHTYLARPVPLMLMHGTADPFAPYQSSIDDYDAARSPKYFVTLVGAKHIQYAEPWLSVSIRASIDFFDGYLKHESSALARLPADASVPGVSRLQHA
jgi:predicted esterase